MCLKVVGGVGDPDHNAHLAAVWCGCVPVCRMIYGLLYISDGSSDSGVEEDRSSKVDRKVSFC